MRNTEYREGVRAWNKDVHFDENTWEQAIKTANMPFIHRHLALMPDAHLGMGATIGSVIATSGAIIPAAVGVDIGCGMCAVRTSLTADDLPDSLKELRGKIEDVVPVGFNQHSIAQKGELFDGFNSRLLKMEIKHPELGRKSKLDMITKSYMQAGTLGGGNHFIEICLDTNNDVWIMLHSGSRGMGNIIGTYFIKEAQKDMERWYINLPDKNLAYIPEGSTLFDDYTEAVELAQEYASLNRQIMLKNIIEVMKAEFKDFKLVDKAVNCHHNYISREHHFNKNVWVTRKGAVRARAGELGIIPGSMGAKSFIVKGLGNEDSFCSCSHGAGRVMSRTAAKKLVTLEEHKKAVEGIECRIDEDVIDETPSAYKNIDDVMAAQSDLVSIEYQLKQVLCIKG